MSAVSDPQSPSIVNPASANAFILVVAMGSLYISWGSSYIGTKFALEGFPPALLGGIRYYLAGSLLFLVLVGMGKPVPTLSQWIGGFFQGVLLLGIGNGAMAFAIQWVASGMVAVGFATIPLWTALLSGLIDKWPNKWEWAGLLIGMGGVILLSLEGDFRSSPMGFSAVMIGAVSFSFGSVISSKVPQPKGLMGTAVGMLSAGIFLIVIGVFAGEQIAVFPKADPLLALVYLIFLPSILAFSAYGYLLDNVGPIKANSFAYTNPVIAVGLGVLLGGESITPLGVLAMGIIIGSLVLLNVGKNGSAATKGTGTP